MEEKIIVTVSFIGGCKASVKKVSELNQPISNIPCDYYNQGVGFRLIIKKYE